MSRHGDVTLDWADGEYTFRLAWGQLIAVQEACDAGPAHILHRLQTGAWRVQDIEAVLLHGLLGGGVPRDRARMLMRSFVHNAPLAENVAVAQAVLLAALLGAPEAEDAAELPPGKPEADPVTHPAPAAT